MSIENARNFLKDDTSIYKMNLEGSLLFIIDNYPELLSLYRVIKAHEEKVSQKKEAAHIELQEFRDYLETLDKSKLTEDEKVMIEEKIEYLKKLRDEDEQIYFKGIPLEYNHLSHTIKNHERLFKLLEVIDADVRLASANCIYRILKVLVTPFTYFMKAPKSPLMTELYSLLNELPNDIKNSIVKSMEVNLDDHQEIK